MTTHKPNEHSGRLRNSLFWFGTVIVALFAGYVAAYFGGGHSVWTGAGTVSTPSGVTLVSGMPATMIRVYKFPLHPVVFVPAAWVEAKLDGNDVVLYFARADHRGLFRMENCYQAVP